MNWILILTNIAVDIGA